MVGLGIREWISLDRVSNEESKDEARESMAADIIEEFELALGCELNSKGCELNSNAGMYNIQGGQHG